MATGGSGVPPDGGTDEQTRRQQQVEHLHQGVQPHQQPREQSYSSKLIQNVNRNDRLKRNVLEVNLESDSDRYANIDKETIARLAVKLGINLQTQAEGYQTGSNKVFFWLKENCDIERFCKEENIRLNDTVKTTLIKPMERKEVTLTIRGLNLNTPDSFVIDYINKHGSVVNDKVIYEIEKDGPLRGLKNGNRRYLVDFTGGRNMGTYHLLDGAKITVMYPGQKKTCGRCQMNVLVMQSPGNVKQDMGLRSCSRIT